MAGSENQIKISRYLDWRCENNSQSVNTFNRLPENLFSSLPWIKVLENTYNFKTYIAEDRLSKYAFLFIPVHNSFGKKIISLPFSDYVRHNAEKAEIITKILNHLEEAYPDYAISFKCDFKPHLIDWGNLQKEAVYHIIDIQNAPVKLSKSFKRSRNKAIKSGVGVNTSYSLDALNRFYSLNSDYRISKFKKAPQPYSFFKNIYHQFFTNGNGFIMDATYQNHTIASILVLQHKNVYYYKFGCSEADALNLRPNNLLFASLIDKAKENKITAIDLGLSGKEDAYQGLRRFKESMGGIQKEISVFEQRSQLYPHPDARELVHFINHLNYRLIQANLNASQKLEISETIYPFFI